MDFRPPAGHLIGMWQPSMAAQQYGDCQISPICRMFFLKSSLFGMCFLTELTHMFSTIALVTSLQIVQTVDTPSPVISAME